MGTICFVFFVPFPLIIENMLEWRIALTGCRTRRHFTVSGVTYNRRERNEVAKVTEKTRKIEIAHSEILHFCKKIGILN